MSKTIGDKHQQLLELLMDAYIFRLQTDAREKEITDAATLSSVTRFLQASGKLFGAEAEDELAALQESFNRRAAERTAKAKELEEEDED